MSPNAKSDPLSRLGSLKCWSHMAHIFPSCLSYQCGLDGISLYNWKNKVDTRCMHSVFSVGGTQWSIGLHFGSRLVI